MGSESDSKTEASDKKKRKSRADSPSREASDAVGEKERSKKRRREHSRDRSRERESANVGPRYYPEESSSRSGSRRSKSFKVGRRYYESRGDDEEVEDRKERAKMGKIGARYYDVKSKDDDESKEKSKDDEKNDKEGATNEVKPVERKAKDMLTSKTGGAYIPPAKLRMMQAKITDKSSAAYQRIAWEALKKSIHGYINKVNTSNLATIVRELLKENVVRGSGLLCRSILQAQAASPTFTKVYAALVAVINSRFPQIGELLLKRLIIQFKRGFKRNDKTLCISSAIFIGHLVNQSVAHELLILEILFLLVETPTNDSIEVTIAVLKEVIDKLLEVAKKGTMAIQDMLRNILHEGTLDKRVQYMIDTMFQIIKLGGAKNLRTQEAQKEDDELANLVEEEDQITHIINLDDATDGQNVLDVFKLDENYEENEAAYKKLREEILGSSDSESGEEGSEDDEDSDDEEDSDEEKKPDTIIDNTETNLVALRRTIYLTIQSSLDFEECAHKLLRMQLRPGQEMEMCHMILDCCAEMRTYEKFFGLLAQRFCMINKIYVTPFQQIFIDSYSTVHRLEINKLRNVAKFFAHLLYTDAISWEVLATCRLTEEDSTSSSRIFIKILFQELSEYMGLQKLNNRVKDPTLQLAFDGLFPRDDPKNTRFAINFFTSIGLGGLTDELREHLKTQPKNAVAPLPVQLAIEGADSSSSSSSSSDSSSSDSSESSSDDSSSESEAEESRKNSKSKRKIKEKMKEKMKKLLEERLKEKSKKKAREEEPDSVRKMQDRDDDDDEEDDRRNENGHKRYGDREPRNNMRGRENLREGDNVRERENLRERDNMRGRENLRERDNVRERENLRERDNMRRRENLRERDNVRERENLRERDNVREGESMSERGNVRDRDNMRERESMKERENMRGKDFDGMDAVEERRSKDDRERHRDDKRGRFREGDRDRQPEEFRRHVEQREPRERSERHKESRNDYSKMDKERDRDRHRSGAREEDRGKRSNR